MGSRFLDPLIKAVISAQTRLADARFVYRRGIPAGKINLLLKYPALGSERCQRHLKTRRDNLLIQRFSRLHERHYGPTGRGYAGISEWNQGQRRGRYESQISRVAEIVASYGDILGYSDADTFADLACGTGQNIRFLTGQFPASEVRGCDINGDALGLIREFEPSPRVELHQGDLRDQGFIEQFLATPVDHVIVCHAFSLLLADSVRETIEMRQRIINLLIRSSRKSVMVLDYVGERGRTSVRIEQAQRMSFTDDIMSYFDDYPQGRAMLVNSSRTQAVIFVHRH